MKKKHLLYIPTNRECRNAIEEYLDECKFIRDYTGEEVYFALIESNNASSAAINSYAISNSELSNISIDLTFEKQELFLKKILNLITDIDDVSKQRIYSLLLPSGTNYGAGPNKAALLAAALGVTIMHRRDSDTYPRIYHGEKLFPSKIECDYILSEYLLNSRKYSKNTIYFIGSNYIGEAPIDYDEIMQIFPEFVYRIKQLENPNRSLQNIITRVQEYFNCSVDNYSGIDKIEEDTTGLSEMGNCCTAEIFLHLPEMPMNDILGCDYMQKNVLYRLNYPILYHNRKIEHLYSNGRDTKHDINQFIDYNLRDVRFKLMMRIRNHHNAILKEIRQLLISEKIILNTDVYINAFKMALSEITSNELSSMIEQIADIYFEVSKRGTDSKYNKYAMLANILLSQSQTLISEVYTGISDYCFLIENWRKLVVAAPKADCAFLFRRV